MQLSKHSPKILARSEPMAMGNRGRSDFSCSGLPTEHPGTFTMKQNWKGGAQRHLKI